MHPSSTRKNVTLADVAKAAGVSKTTASHALSGRGYVALATRETVLRLAGEMGFEADPLARVLSSGQNESSIAFFTLDLDLSSRTRLLQLIQSRLNDQGFSVPVHAYGYRGADVARHQLEVMAGALSGKPRALVCNLAQMGADATNKLRRFVDDGGLCVAYGYDGFADLNCDQVICAEDESFALAARHLFEQGHRELGVFSVGLRKPSGSMLEAVEQEARRFGATLRDEWLFGNDGTRRYEEDGACLAQEFLALSHRPSAMIVANDYAAAAFLAVLQRNGVRVPHDVSVVGHDDDAIAPFAVVPLTTTSVPVEAMARQVVELLLSRLRGDAPAEAQRTVVRGELILRSSTAKYVN